MIEGDIGYMRVAQMYDGAARDAHAALQELTGQGAKELVLDLRNCPGGLPEEMVDIGSLFLPSGTLMLRTSSRVAAYQSTYEADTRERIPTLLAMPLMVIVSRGTFGLCEALAASLQDHQRARVIGATTHGWGVMQMVLPLADGSGLRLSVAEYHRPSGATLNDAGVQPDVPADPSSDDIIRRAADELRNAAQSMTTHHQEIR